MFVNDGGFGVMNATDSGDVFGLEFARYRWEDGFAVGQSGFTSGGAGCWFFLVDGTKFDGSIEFFPGDFMVEQNMLASFNIFHNKSVELI